MNPADNEAQLKDLDLEIKKRLSEFSNLKEDVNILSSTLDQRMFSNIELFLKEIKDISVISVTAAPFSLTILLSNFKINTTLLVFSFVIFMLNVLILNIGIWYINNEFLRSTSSQKLENMLMDISANDINNNSLETNKRTEALFKFFESENKINTKRKLEPYKYINIVDKIRFLGIIMLNLAIILLTTSIILPTLTN